MANKSKFEMAIIDEVRKTRVAKRFTQSDLAEFLNVSRGFIGQIESPKTKSKYKLEHLNQLAISMKCSPKDFMPLKPAK